MVKRKHTTRTRPNNNNNIETGRGGNILVGCFYCFLLNPGKTIINRVFLPSFTSNTTELKEPPGLSSFASGSNLDIMMLKPSDETCNQIHTFPSFVKVVSLPMRDAPCEAESTNKAGIEPVVMLEGGNHLNLWCVWRMGGGGCEAPLPVGPLVPRLVFTLKYNLTNMGQGQGHAYIERSIDNLIKVLYIK